MIYVYYVKLILPEIWSVVSHIFFTFMIELLYLMEEYILMAVTIIVTLISICMHLSSFFSGMVGFQTLENWKMTDHISAQAMVVAISLMLLIVDNREARNAIIILVVTIQALLMRISDVFHFTIGMTGTIIVLSVYFHYDRWAKAVKHISFWAALIFGCLAFSLFFIPQGQDYTHGLWHALIAIDGCFWLIVIHSFFSPKNKKI